MVVLDRDQSDESQELIGATRLLGVRQRCRREARERGRDRLLQPLHAGLVARQSGAPKLGECPCGRPRGKRPTLSPVARRKHLPGAGELRGDLRPAGGEPPLAEPRQLVDAFTSPALGRIEHVLDDRETGGPGRRPPTLERAQRQRGIGPRAGVAGGRAELAQQQPRSRRRHVASLDRGEGRRQRAAEEGRLDGAPDGGQRDWRFRAGRAPQAAQDLAMGCRIRPPQAGAQSAGVRVRGVLDVAVGAPLVEQQRGLGVEQAVPDSGRGPPGLGRSGGGRPCGRQPHQRGDERSPTHLARP